MTTLKNLKIYTEDKVIENGSIVFDQNIQKILTTSIEGVDMKGAICIPGFLNQHVHGTNGYDFMDASKEALTEIASSLVREGITSYFATTVTSSLPHMKEALSGIAQFIDEADQTYLPKCYGIHLEGPYLAKEKKGAHEETCLSSPIETPFTIFDKESKHYIKFVTLAPEIDGGLELVKELKSQNIIASIGHTNADYETALEAIQNGSTCFTHVFNAMPTLHHRKANATLAMLLKDETYAEVIADGIHLSKEIIELLLKTKGPDKIILVTDSIRATALQDGTYLLGELPVYVKDGIARLEDGTLAGSTLKMIDAMNFMRKNYDLSIQDLIKITSTNSATLNHLDQKGSLKVGKDADLLILDEDFNILSVYSKGIQIF